MSLVTCGHLRSCWNSARCNRSHVDMIVMMVILWRWQAWWYCRDVYHIGDNDNDHGDFDIDDDVDDDDKADASADAASDDKRKRETMIEGRKQQTYSLALSCCFTLLSSFVYLFSFYSSVCATFIVIGFIGLVGGACDPCLRSGSCPTTMSYAVWLFLKRLIL